MFFIKVFTLQSQGKKKKKEEEKEEEEEEDQYSLKYQGMY